MVTRGGFLYGKGGGGLIRWDCGGGVGIDDGLIGGVVVVFVGPGVHQMMMVCGIMGNVRFFLIRCISFSRFAAADYLSIAMETCDLRPPNRFAPFSRLTIFLQPSDMSLKWR